MGKSKKAVETDIKPKITKRVDFEIPYGIADKMYEWNTLLGSTYKFRTEDEAVEARSFEWDGDPVSAAVVAKEGKTLVFIGHCDYGDRLFDEDDALFKLSTGIAKRLIKRALAAKAGKQAGLTEHEKRESRMRSKYRPYFERIPGDDDYFLFVAPCGQKNYLRGKTVQQLLETIEFAEKEIA